MRFTFNSSEAGLFDSCSFGGGGWEGEGGQFDLRSYFKKN